MRKLPLLMTMAIGMAFTGNAQQDLAKNNIDPSLLLKEAPATLLGQQQSTAFRSTKTAEDWKRLRRAGIVLTSVGIASVAGGITLIAVGDHQNGKGYWTTYDDTPGDDKIVMGVLGIAGGITALGGGITMWAIGNNRLRKYTNRMSFDVGGRSARLAYRF
ncbi:hypothetical protein [Niabella beijingensis]|uniref:hypothetical protein n=1 Tax=Niabella beijingensis TaxID=2872700 RepID=UPI001CC12E24|nr:hypothetical protein [Niabella beijingensis]MBZ4189761.1 hypothetical protein [Niabella beijingensis]